MLAALIRYPLPPASKAVPVASLAPNTPFLRIVGTPQSGYATPDLWVLESANPDNNTVVIVNLLNLQARIAGVSGDMGVIPYPCDLVPR